MEVSSIPITNEYRSHHLFFSLSIETLEVEDGDPVTNMTFEGDFDALEASSELELKRVMIYNYLLSVEMPITSDITMWKRM